MLNMWLQVKNAGYIEVAITRKIWCGLIDYFNLFSSIFTSIDTNEVRYHGMMQIWGLFGQPNHSYGSLLFGGPRACATACWNGVHPLLWHTII